MRSACLPPPDRTCDDGTAMMTKVEGIRNGRRIRGLRRAFREGRSRAIGVRCGRSRLIAVATSSVRAISETGSCMPMIRASVVPHATGTNHRDTRWRTHDGRPRGRRAPAAMRRLPLVPAPPRRGSLTALRSRKISRIGVPSKPNASRNPVLEIAAIAEVDRLPRRWRRTRTLAEPRRPGWRRKSFGPAALDHRRRIPLGCHGEHPIQLAGRDALAALAPDVDRRLEDRALRADTVFVH